MLPQERYVLSEIFVIVRRFSQKLQAHKLNMIKKEKLARLPLRIWRIWACDVTPTSRIVRQGQSLGGQLTEFSCLHLHHWPMTYLMTLSDWLMSCQAWPPPGRCSQWARCKHSRPVVYFLYKMVYFNIIYQSIVKPIQLEFQYDIKIGVFYIGTVFQGDMIRSCSVVAESKYSGTCIVRPGKSF